MFIYVLLIFAIHTDKQTFSFSQFFPVAPRTFVCYHDIKGDDTMANICTLESDINQCPHYSSETQTCNGGPEECGFYKKMIQRR